MEPTNQALTLDEENCKLLKCLTGLSCAASDCAHRILENGGVPSNRNMRILTNRVVIWTDRISRWLDGAFPPNG